MVAVAAATEPMSASHTSVWSRFRDVPAAAPCSCITGGGARVRSRIGREEPKKTGETSKRAECEQQGHSAVASRGRCVLLYFCEDGGEKNGVHARDASGKFYTLLGGWPAHPSESTGLAFSPDKKQMYVAFQGDLSGHLQPGVLYAIFRLDGRPFGGRTLDIKYHED